MIVNESKGLGDVFGDALWPGPATTVSSWHIRLEDAQMGRRETKHKIDFRHNSGMGSWVLIVDGVFQANGYEPIINRSFVVGFVLEGREATITADGLSGVFFVYSLRLQGNLYPEFRHQVESGLGELLPLQISIPSHRTQFEDNKVVVIYQILVKAGNGDQLVVERRFRQFDMLSRLIVAQTSSHLANSLPSMPSKIVSPWTDQTSDNFITLRRLALQKYLTQLLGNSKVVHYSDFLCFLGLHPVTGLPIEPIQK